MSFFLLSWQLLSCPLLPAEQPSLKQMKGHCNIQAGIITACFSVGVKLNSLWKCWSAYSFWPDSLSLYSSIIPSYTLEFLWLAISVLKEKIQAGATENRVYNPIDYFMLMNELSSIIIFHFLCPPGGSKR